MFLFKCMFETHRPFTSLYIYAAVCTRNVVYKANERGLEAENQMMKLVSKFHRSFFLFTSKPPSSLIFYISVVFDNFFTDSCY